MSELVEIPDVQGWVLRSGVLRPLGTTGWTLRGGYTPPPPRFAGDPGPGKLYVGGHEPDGASNPWPDGTYTLEARYDEANRGPIGIVRRFFQTSWTDLASKLAADKAAGRVSWVSFKPGGTFYGRTASQVAARYTQMLQILEICRDSGHTVWVAMYHEPENDDKQGSTEIEHPAEWAVVQQQLADAWVEVGSPANVATSSILMSWSLRTISPRLWQEWQAATEPVQIQGIDYYAYASNPTANRLLVSTPLFDVMARTDPNRPVAFAELGQTRSIETTIGPGAWEQQMARFYEYARDSGGRIVAGVYFDSPFSDNAENSVEEWQFTNAERDWFNQTLRTRDYVYPVRI